MEPLLLLREANKKGESVVLEGDSIVFKSSKRTFPRSFPTAYFPSRGREKQPYTLEVVWFLFQHADKSFREYVSECVRAGINRVQIVDSRDLIAFLRGETDTCPGLKVSNEADETQAPKQGLLTTQLQPRKDSETLIREALEQEHDQRSLSSLLTSKDRSFKYLVEKIKVLRKSHKETDSLVQPEQKPVKKHQMDPRGDRYSIREDMFYRENIGAEVDELGIDPSARFGLPSNSSNTGMNGSGDQNNPRSELVDSTVSSVRENGKRKAKVDATPIIVVPAGYNSLINILNASEFLEQGRFVPWQTLKAQGVTNVSWSVRIKHVSGIQQTPVEYQIVNNTSRLTAEDWKRVCAVICSGAAWQFKGWPYPGTAELFADIRGFYFHYDDEQVDPNVRGWVVKCLPISRNKRHLDSSVALEFWKSLELHIKSKRPFLRV
eukprot:jgi/Galph1/4817/GphlegSOOS_G3457.1